VRAFEGKLFGEANAPEAGTNPGKSGAGRRWAVCALVALLLALGTTLGHAAEVRVPLTIDYLTLGEAIRHQLYTAPGDRAALWNGPDECQFLYAENPSFGRANERVQLETTAALSLGVALGSGCVSPFTWSGIVEAESEPYLARGLRLMLRIADINLYNPRRQKTLIAGRGFDLIKRYLVPRMETFSYDLNPALQQLGALAEAAATPAVAGRIQNALATVRADPTVTATDDGIKITLIVAVPQVPEPVASETPAQPTPAELEAFQKQLDDWDAFLVFAVKQLGAAVGDRQFRSELLDILLTSRYRLTQALASSPSAAGPDPVRTLFVDSWQKLGLAVRGAARRGQFGSRTLQFLSFISAGDALFALDQAAPALGMRISADDLRRLAHIMAPEATGDPLEFNFAEDPELKRLLGPTLVPLTSTPEGSPTISSSPAETPGAAGPSTNPAPTPQATPQTSGWLHIPWSLIEPRDVCAAEPLGIVPQLNQVALRLRRVVVDEANAPGYRGDMERLLELSVQRQLEASDLDARLRPTFHKLVKSAAWQESCWRQFIKRDDQVTWLESSTGDIGLMQVNKHVWRGFYNLEKLKWDVLYNAGAGTEILMQMTQRVLTRPDPTGIDGAALARSVYASYNGGPEAYSRWRLPNEASTAREIDAAFLDKYRAVAGGQTINILSCAAAWGQRAGH
jgi:hypothetical protein